MSPGVREAAEKPGSVPGGPGRVRGYHHPRIHRLSQLAANVLNLSKIENMSILSDMERFDLTEGGAPVHSPAGIQMAEKELELIIDMDEVSYL